MIRNIKDLCEKRNRSSFSVGGDSSKGIFALIDYNWQNQDAQDTPLKWHRGDLEVDP